MMAMGTIDITALRTRIRATDTPRGTPEQIVLWREDLDESRANLVIENMVPTPQEDALFAMMLEEGLSPAAMVEVIKGLYQPLGGAD